MTHNIMVEVAPDREAFQFMLEEAAAATSYWSAFDHAVRDDDGNVVAVTLSEVEEHAWPGQPAVYGEPVVLTVDKLIAGAQRLVHPSSKVNSRIRQDVTQLLIGGDADWDFETTDCVVQLTMLKELRYG